MSELVTNLQTIYNTKLAIKAAIGTESDIFEDYPAYIAAMDGSGITPSGTSYITTNGEHDVTSYAYAYVDVEGGGGGDPFADYYDIVTIVEEDLVGENINYYGSVLSDNYEATDNTDYEEAEPVYEFVLEWDEYQNIDGNDVTVHVIANANYNPLSNIENDYPDNMSDLYDYLYPILENAVVTESEDPSNDGYDYLVEGDLKYFNLQDLSASVETIYENGFYPVNGNAAFNVDIAENRDTTKTIYNFITHGGNNKSTIEFDLLNNSYLNNCSTLIMKNCDELNYIDESTGLETINSYYRYMGIAPGNTGVYPTCWPYIDDDGNQKCSVFFPSSYTIMGFYCIEMNGQYQYDSENPDTPPTVVWTDGTLYGSTSSNLNWQVNSTDEYVISGPDNNSITIEVSTYDHIYEHERDIALRYIS